MYSISIYSVFSTRLSIYSFFWAWQVVVSAPACQHPSGDSSLSNSDDENVSSSVKYYNHSEDLQKYYRKKHILINRYIYLFTFRMTIHLYLGPYLS
jgi:hypothetical protein